MNDTETRASASAVAVAATQAASLPNLTNAIAPKTGWRPAPRRFAFVTLAPVTHALVLVLAFAFTLALAPRAEAKFSVPPWLAEASTRAAPRDKDTSAEILHSEEVLSVAPNGRMTRTVRQAIRIVTRDGRSAAATGIPYDSASQKITDFKAWLVWPNGDGKTYGIKDAVDASMAAEAVYSEMRLLLFVPGDNAYEDCVYGVEYTIDDRGIFADERWYFQTVPTLPTALSRLTYKIPKGWTISAKTANHAEIAPVVNGNTYTWELRDLPALKQEPLCPSYPRVAPRVSVDLVPPAGMKNPPLMTFRDWTAVSIYNTNLYTKPSVPDATVAAKAAALLATAGPSLWARINALARFAQAINYVEISTNVGRGGGMIPRAASDILRTGYGVCRDKVALLRALLKAANIESYPVAAYLGDRYQVTEDWPTPGQFNHAIIAIKIDDPALKSPAIVEHPALGRLLFFDPTNPFTPLGDLVSDQQGSLVLVLADERGALLRLPFTAPADNRLDRSIDATLDAAGGITARITEHSTGQSAASERAGYRNPKIKYPDQVRAWVNDSVPAAKILKTDATDSQEQGTFDLAVEFTARNYAKMMRDKLLMFKPAIVERRDFVPLTKPTRAYPVVIEPRAYSETAVIAIPDGYAVDELPPPMEATESFGHYKAETTFDAAKRQVLYHRTLERKAAEVPASDYAKVRQFFETIYKAEQTPVVLIKQ